MNVPKETQDKIVELQMLEQNIHSFAMQKQQFQISLNEIENALSELKSTKDEVYKIIGDIMIKTDRQSLEKNLNEKKNILELRVKNIEKQEEKIKEKAEQIQKEVLKNIENEKPRRSKGDNRDS